MKLTPFKQILAMSGEKIKEALAPIRAKKAKAKANLEQVKIEEQIATLESDVTEICAKDDLDFDAIIQKLDKVALLERRKKQFDKIIKELFPED